jgi:hypothetical protein
LASWLAATPPVMRLNTYRAAVAVALLGVLVTSSAAAVPVAYQTTVVNAVDTCAPRNPGQAALRGCVGELAAPHPVVRHEVDLWNTFLDCLSAWYVALDEMYPPRGGDVNSCLEQHGWDVQP